VRAEVESEFEGKVQALRAEHEAKLADLEARYPQLVARRLAEGLLRSSADLTVAQILEQAEALPVEALRNAAPVPEVAPATAPAPAVAEAASPPPAAASPESAPESAEAALEEAEADEELSMEPYIDTVLCTSCDDCIKVNKQMFAYDDNKQAYIKDARAGTFKQLVMAAEVCPAEIIHPGTPLDPDEKDLDKLVKRAERFG
jgi:pyruvate-ferredoxin/flavodoxin oxidoreductase